MRPRGQRGAAARRCSVQRLQVGARTIRERQPPSQSIPAALLVTHVRVTWWASPSAPLTPAHTTLPVPDACCGRRASCTSSLLAHGPKCTPPSAARVRHCHPRRSQSHIPPHHPPTHPPTPGPPPPGHASTHAPPLALPPSAVALPQDRQPTVAAPAHFPSPVAARRQRGVERPLELPAGLRPCRCLATCCKRYGTQVGAAFVPRGSMELPVLCGLLPTP